MSYLRTGELKLKGLDEEETEELKAELDYYQIPLSSQSQDMSSSGNQNGWKWDDRIKDDGVSFSPDKKIATTHSRFGAQRVVFGDNSVSSFKVKVAIGSGYADIGMAPQNYKLNRFDRNARMLPISVGGSGFGNYSIDETSVIEVVHDKTERKIRFIIDGRAVDRLVLEDISDNITLYPAVSCGTDGKFEIIS